MSQETREGEANEEKPLLRRWMECVVKLRAMDELKAENAALRSQLAAAESRLAAAERLLRSVDQVYVGDVKLHRTSVGKIHLSRLVPARETLEHQSTDTKNLIDAYLAAVAANWLPGA